MVLVSASTRFEQLKSGDLNSHEFPTAHGAKRCFAICPAFFGFQLEQVAQVIRLNTVA